MQESNANQLFSPGKQAQDFTVSLESLNGYHESHSSRVPEIAVAAEPLDESESSSSDGTETSEEDVFPFFAGIFSESKSLERVKKLKKLIAQTGSDQSSRDQIKSSTGGSTKKSDHLKSSALVLSRLLEKPMEFVRNLPKRQPKLKNIPTYTSDRRAFVKDFKIEMTDKLRDDRFVACLSMPTAFNYERMLLLDEFSMSMSSHALNHPIIAPSLIYATQEELGDENSPSIYDTPHFQSYVDLQTLPSSLLHTRPARPSSFFNSTFATSKARSSAGRPLAPIIESNELSSDPSANRTNSFSKVDVEKRELEQLYAREERKRKRASEVPIDEGDEGKSSSSRPKRHASKIANNLIKSNVADDSDNEHDIAPRAPVHVRQTRHTAASPALTVPAVLPDFVLSACVDDKEKSNFLHYRAVLAPKLLANYPGLTIETVEKKLIARWKSLPAKDKMAAVINLTDSANTAQIDDTDGNLKDCAETEQIGASAVSVVPPTAVVGASALPFASPEMLKSSFIECPTAEPLGVAETTTSAPVSALVPTVIYAPPTSSVDNEDANRDFHLFQEIFKKKVLFRRPEMDVTELETRIREKWQTIPVDKRNDFLKVLRAQAPSYGLESSIGNPPPSLPVETPIAPATFATDQPLKHYTNVAKFNDDLPAALPTIKPVVEVLEEGIFDAFQSYFSYHILTKYPGLEIDQVKERVRARWEAYSFAEKVNIQKGLKKRGFCS